MVSDVDAVSCADDTNSTSHTGPATSQMIDGSTQPETASEQPKQSAECEVLFTMRCSAGMPWPLSSSIENIMADKAQVSMNQAQAHIAPHCTLQ